MNSIEEKLWDYIDGNCSPDERAAIDQLLISDERYQQKYLELLAFNREIAAMELDEPSMAFTYKVMENIRAEHARQPLKTHINNTLIKVIGGFFIVTISALLIFTLVNAVSTGTVTSVPDVKGPEIKMPDLGHFMSGSLLKGSLFLCTVFILFLLDGLVRKQVLQRQP